MFKIKLKRVVFVAFFFVVFGVIQVLYDFATFSESPLQSGQFGKSFYDYIFLNIILGFLSGIICGLTLNYSMERFSDKPYYKTLILIIFVFTVTWFMASLAKGITFNTLSPASWQYHFNITILDYRDLAYWLFIVFLAYLIIQMENKFGPGKSFDLFIGKYNTPNSENRIFMFLDLKSSTTIAERIGNTKYHNLLRTLFADITVPILNSGAEIYQYVGDEVVLSWQLSTSQDQGLESIKCFFEIQEKLESNIPKYMRQFEIKPQLKAGIHIGKVAVGEIGIIKRDIAYSGDVLNTASRVQGLCNDFNAIILVTKQLIEYSSGITNHYKIQLVGSVNLKGKSKMTSVYRLSQY